MPRTIFDLVAGDTGSTLQAELRDKGAQKKSIRSSTYAWTASANGSNEYYVTLAAGGDPSLAEPDTVFFDSFRRERGMIGALGSGHWSYGDNDSLGYNTVYVRLDDDADPDDTGTDFVEAYIEQIDLTGKTVTLRWKIDDEDMVEQTMTIVTPAYEGKATYTWASGELTAGAMSYQIIVDDGSQLVTSLNKDRLLIDSQIT